MNNYSTNSIQSLNYFEHIRKYPGMYIGSKDENGLLHCIKEILSNSIDEWLNGAGSEIYIEIDKTNSVFIKDNGRGIPHGKHDNGMSLLSACFGVANTGGKFNNATGASGYNSSGGEHGTGGKAVNALSKKMIITTCRDGIKETSEFSKGILINEYSESIDKNISGTSVYFCPDEEIFETTKINEEKLKTMIQEFSFLCKDLKFIFIYNNKQYEFLSSNGLYDYIEYLNGSKDMLINPFYFEDKDGNFQMEIAFGYNNNYNSNIKLYTNNIPQIKGTHLTGFKTAITSTFNSLAKEKKWLKDGEENLNGADLEEGLIAIINFKMIDPVFKGQNKEELSSSEGRTYVQRFTTNALKNIITTREKDIKLIFEKAHQARKAREAAKKARDTVRKKTEKKKKALKFDSKLADCYSKDRLKCEIMVVEGDSAAGNLKQARNNEFQAVMPVRGKILNTQKATLDKIMKNAEIMTMIEAFGLTADSKTMKLSFSEDSLRYGKIIILSDADVDGAHIKSLFYTFIWNFCPELIEKGYVYAAVPPLYKITTSKGYKYLKNDAALEEYRKDNINKKYQVGRMKGLGEMSIDETEETLTNPENRILKQLTISDMTQTNKIFEDLMGDGVAARKLFIKNHSVEAKGDI